MHKPYTLPFALTSNSYRNFARSTGTTGTLEHAGVSAGASTTSGVPVTPDVPPTTGTLEHGPSTALFVSTAIESWRTEQPGVFARDVQINDTAYRRLDPEYYAWLRSRMQLAKMAASAGKITPNQYDNLRCRFNAVHEWAIEQFGEICLAEAIRTLDARSYVPPAAEPDHACQTPNAPETASSAVVALVDSIRDRALSLGWKRDRLYSHAGRDRRIPGLDRGLVSFLKSGDQVGEVTAQSIEIILQDGVHQRFYNPDIDQPWIVRTKK